MNKLEALNLIHRDHFTVPEWLEREKCINAIRQYDSARLLAEQALTKIRDKNLYRPYKNLKEFCQSTFGWSDRRTQQMLAAEKVILALPDKKRTIVRTESQARELSKIEPEKRVKVLDEASKNGEITAKSIEKAASKFSDIQSVDDNGTEIPKNALPYWNRRPEAKSLLQHISSVKCEIEKLEHTDAMWANVNLNGVVADLKSAFNRFTAAIPKYVCPYCKGVKVQGCKCCKGRGVISDYLWKTIPEEIRKKSQHPF